MKTLKKILLVVVGLIVVLAVVGLLLPGSYRVERSLVIQAAPERVFTHVNTLKHWPEWTAWTVQRYPDMKVQFAGPDAGIGASYEWSGQTSGQGNLKITGAVANKSVAYDLDFDHGKHRSKGLITIAPEGDAVRVTWANFGDLGLNPISRWFGALMDKMMGPDFELCLKNLKARAEAK